ncbi:MAG: RQC domain-containing protein, partial [Wenzhouxiangella sp.]
LLNYFDEAHPGRCGNCDNCLEPPETWDATEAARMALSCAYRSGERFGAGHVIDVLMGKDSDRIANFGHDKQSTFGIGRDIDKKTWHSVLRQLLALGHLQPDPEGHGGLQLGPECRPLLKGEHVLMLRRDSVPEGRRQKSKSRARVNVDIESPGWQALREWRLLTAQEENVPPYVIFHDATLAAILEAQPETLEELADITGVGKHKLEKYGRDVLEVLAGIGV